MKQKGLLSLLLVLCLLLSLTACGSGAASASGPAEAPVSAEASAEALEEAAAPAEDAPAAEPANVGSAVETEASAAEPAEPAEPDIDCDEVFVVVHTNDVHGFIDIEPYVKAVADEYKARYGDQNVVTVSAGDVFAGGNAVAHLYNGETIPPVMDAAGYDLLAPGNNDFNLGGDQLLVLAGMFDRTQVICANLFAQILDENDEVVVDEDGYPVQGETIFDRTMTRETAGGVKVGLFGLTVSGGPINDSFAGMGSIQAAQEAVDSLQSEDCSVIVGVGHTGWNDDLVTPNANDTTSAELVKEVPGIDVYVDGHTHSIIGDGNGWVCPETGTLVNQASCKGECVGVMMLYIKDGKVVEKDGRLIMEEELKANYEPDPEVQKVVDEAWARLESDAGEMYLESEYFLDGYRTSESPDGRSIRTDETNLGDLVADFLRWYGKTDVGMMPGFRIRSSVQQGKIYTINLYDVFANGCDLYTFEITGEELLQKMAKSLNDLPVESTQFNQISGASYGYLKESSMTEDGQKVFTIINPMVGGEPLDPEKIYTLAADAGGPDAPEDQDPLFSGMEPAAEAMGEFLKSGEAQIFPDVPIPDNRIVPMDEIPEGAVIYEVELEPMPEGGPGGPPPGGAGAPPAPPAG
ncbi:MAG: bifunctional metallophosphatase/5'-nucleotidase [Oscillospiraceae bacterium]|nr:bifunctional metallophosphatase/5'-nucleotidase [Oscillospiraceae bacterium]